MNWRDGFWNTIKIFALVLMFLAALAWAINWAYDDYRVRQYVIQQIDVNEGD